MIEGGLIRAIAWTDFIKSVEAVEPAEDVISKVAEVFVDKLSAQVPLQAEGIPDDVLDGKLAGQPPPVVALARRTLRNVEAAAVARRAQASQGGALFFASTAAANAKRLGIGNCPK